MKANHFLSSLFLQDNYPINHVIIFEKYICSLLKSNEIKNLQCAYYDTDDENCIFDYDYMKNITL